LDEEPGEPRLSDDGEEKLYLPPTLAISQDVPLDEPEQTPEEVVDLLEQEFGAFAPPGEEMLLFEPDAVLFQGCRRFGWSLSRYTSCLLASTLLFKACQDVVHLTLIDSLFTLHSGSYLLSQTIIEKSSTVDPLPFTARGGIEDQGLVAVRT